MLTSNKKSVDIVLCSKHLFDVKSLVDSYTYIFKNYDVNFIFGFIDFKKEVKINHREMIFFYLDSSQTISENLNFLAMKGNGEYVVFTTPECIPELESFRVNELLEEADESICGVLIKYLFNENLIYSAGGAFNSSHFKYHIYPKHRKDLGDLKKYKVPFISDNFIFLSRSLLRNLGFLSKSLNSNYALDLCLKAYVKGISTFIYTDSILYLDEIVYEEREQDIAVINNKFTVYYKSWIRKDLIEKSFFWFSRKPRIAFIVSSTSFKDQFGDIFTSYELFNKLKEKLDADFFFINASALQDLKNVDVVINMIESAEIENIKDKNLVKIMWIRNWFDRFIEKNSFNQYDIILTSSVKFYNYLSEIDYSFKYVFKIATNTERFFTNEKTKRDLDVIFIGSYWGSNRDFINNLDPKKIPYKFEVWGKGWENIESYKNYWQGEVDYSKVNSLYQRSKIVIDDANHVTKKWGSVNSRVYDATSSGSLVVTNSKESAKDFSNGIQPLYENKADLESILEYYISENCEREKLVCKLKKNINLKNTYTKRATELKNILKNYSNSGDYISIKICAPNYNDAKTWGDFYYALSMKKQLQAYGFNVSIDCMNEWYNTKSNEQIVIMLRGLSRYIPKTENINIMWNISHPDKISLEEYKEFDYVFIASRKHCVTLSNIFGLECEELLQCTDPENFYRVNDKKINKYDLLFVGNTRGVERKIITDVVNLGYKVSIFGEGWCDKHLNNELGGFIKNDKLKHHYSSANIVLNDHWDSMRNFGFISNRVFDALACGSKVLTDSVDGLDIFNELNNIKSYNDIDELNCCLSEGWLITDEDINKSIRYIVKNHTFSNRVFKIVDRIKRIKSVRWKRYE